MVAYQAADNSELSKKAKIYGKKGKPLTKHQIAINEAQQTLLRKILLLFLTKVGHTVRVLSGLTNLF